MNWNSEQVAAIDSILKFIKQPFNWQDPECAITIRGYAGTGKTTLVQEAIKQAQQLKPELQVCVTAPTNKATEVLRDFGKSAGIFVDNSTIYSLLGLVLGSEGEVRRVFQGGDGSFGNYDIVIVDECSMVGMDLFNTIMERSAVTGTKVIFMGDGGQLNPVREKESQTFNQELIPVQEQLTKIMRQDEGSPIRKVVGGMRELAESGTPHEKFKTEETLEGDGVHVLKGNDFKEAMLDQFDCDEYRNNSRFCRILAWTNKEVDRLNRLIRTRLYGAGCEPYIVGEDLCVLTPVMIENIPTIFTDEEVTVTSVGTGQMTDRADFETLEEGHPTYKTYILRVRKHDGKSHNISVLHPDSKVAFLNRKNHLLKKAKTKIGTWKMFYAFQELFTQVRPVHAMTIHKSQGQTFENVFFLATDAIKNKSNKERARLGYVACSRPTTNLIINVERYQ